MPAFGERWVQCVLGGWGGERLWAHHPRRQWDLSAALPLPAPLLAKLLVTVLILHPLQPKPGKVLKHNVVICGVAWNSKEEVSASHHSSGATPLSPRPILEPSQGSGGSLCRQGLLFCFSTPLQAEGNSPEG